MSAAPNRTSHVCWQLGGVMNVAMSYFCIKMVRYVLMYQLALFLKVRHEEHTIKRRQMARHGTRVRL